MVRKVTKLARRIPAEIAICPECGEDLPNGPGYCLHCGRDTSQQEPIRAFRSRAQFDDEMPVRVSHVFFFDRLLFTNWWYVPVGLLLISVLSLLLLSVMRGACEIAQGVLVAATIAIILWLLVRKRQRVAH